MGGDGDFGGGDGDLGDGEGDLGEGEGAFTTGSEMSPITSSGSLATSSIIMSGSSSFNDVSTTRDDVSTFGDSTIVTTVGGGNGCATGEGERGGTVSTGSSSESITVELMGGVTGLGRPLTFGEDGGAVLSGNSFSVTRGTGGELCLTSRRGVRAEPGK